MKKLHKIDWNSYGRLFFGMLLPSPLIHAFFRLQEQDGFIENAWNYTFVLYAVMMLLAISMFNYLETGSIIRFAKRVEDKNGKSKSR